MLPSRRIRTEVSIKFRPNYGRMNGKAILKNISLTGAFLDFSQTQLIKTNHLKKKDKIVIFFSVSHRDRKIASSIIWKNEIGCGVRFHPHNRQDLQIVDDFIFFIKRKKKKKREIFLSLLKKLNST